MNDTPTIAAARRFLSLILEGAPPADEVLARALDELALAYHDTPDGEPHQNESEPPKTDYEGARSRLSERFPHYGHYPVAWPLSNLDEKPVLGDAIDDLADICGDLQKAIWRFEVLGPDDAHWHFKLQYQIHWGRHLRQVAYYLYEIIGHEKSERW